MSLSTDRFFDIFYSELIKEYPEDISCVKIMKYFTQFLINFSKIEIKNIFNKWHGIDAISSVLLIHISQHTKNKIFGISIYPDFIDEQIMKSIYKLIDNEYRLCCQQSFKKDFVPNILGLETILKKLCNEM